MLIVEKERMTTVKKEIEIRILNVDKKKFIEDIIALGAKKQSEYLQKRYVYDFNPVNPKKWIRLRTNGVKNTITIKEIINNQVIDGTNELEVEVSDFNKANLILKELGYVPRNYQENHRIVYNLNEVEISIDTWPKIPTYVELEAKSEELIKKLLSIIEYNEKDLTTLDVASIYMNVYGIDIMSIKELKFDSNSKNLLECNKQMQQKL